MNKERDKYLTEQLGECCGLCECGCGEITSLAPKTSKLENIKQGEHRRFCFGHQNRRYIKNHNKPAKRGQFIHSGYVYVLAPSDHPFPTNKKYIKRCRLVAEQVIGRYLTHEEQVHHINMQRDDDDPKNLQVMMLSEHNKLHRKAKTMQKERIYEPR